jgi:hypothetical protein
MATRTISAAGGTRVWSDTASWDEGVVPTSADDVVARGDGTSGALRLSDARSVKSITFLNYAATFTHDAGIVLTVAGSGVTVKWVSGMTYTLGSVTAGITFTGTSGTNLFTSAGKTFGAVVQNGAGGTTQLQDDLACDTMTRSNGSIDFNNKNLTASGNGGFSSTAATVGTLTLGSGTLTVGSWNCTTAPANLTVTAGTSTIHVTAGGSILFRSGGQTWYDVVIDGPLDAVFPTITLATADTFHNLTITQRVAGVGGLGSAILLTTGATYTVTGTFTVTGNANTRLTLLSATPGQVATINAAAVTLSHAIFIDIAGGGAAAPWTGTDLGDGQGCSGITFDSPVPQYWFGQTGNVSDPTKWFTGSGGTGSAGRVPLPQDHAIFDAASFTGAGWTVTQDKGGQVMRNLDMSAVAFTGTFAMNGGISNGIGVFGSVVLSSNVTITTTNGASNFEMLDRHASTMLTAGVAIPCRLRIIVPGTTLTLLDALTVSSSSGVLHDFGTWDTGGFAVSMVAYSSTNSNTRALSLHGSTVTVTGTSGTPWTTATSTGMTLTAGTSTIVFSGGSASTKTLALGGLSYHNVQITGAGAGVWTISGSNTFADLYTDALAKTINFTAGTTQTVTTFTVNGALGNVITLQSSLAATAWNLSCPSGTVRCQYLSLKDSHASGGASFIADLSTNVSGNTGWDFTGISPSTSISPSASRSPSASLSPSASVSPSASISPSVSASMSASASISPSVSASISASASISPSVSASISASASRSPSSSLSPSVSTSASTSPSASRSPSTSASASPSVSARPQCVFRVRADASVISVRPNPQPIIRVRNDVEKVQP